MLLFSAFSLSHSPQLCLSGVISHMHKEKAGFLCHPAASGAEGFQGNAEYRRWPWACWGVGGRLVSMRGQVVSGHFYPTRTLLGMSHQCHQCCM